MKRLADLISSLLDTHVISEFYLSRSITVVFFGGIQSKRSNDSTPADIDAQSIDRVSQNTSVGIFQFRL